MRDFPSIAKEAAEDIFFGQVVTNWARWFIIVAGAVLVLATAADTGKLVMGTIPVVALMAMNFYLHGRYAAERPVNPNLIMLASLADLAVITLLVSLWPGQNGLLSQFFVLYYPVVLAFAFVMPRKATVVFTLAALGAYAAACFLSNPGIFTYQGTPLEGTLNVIAAKGFVMRLITLAAMGGLGTYFWRVQRNRLRAAKGEHAEVQGRSASA
jgi:hypothetical protein